MLESVLVAAIVANHVPDMLISGTVSALTVTSVLERSCFAFGTNHGSSTEKDVVANLMLEVKMVPTLPPGLLTLSRLAQLPSHARPRIEEVLNAVEVAIVGNEHW